MIRFILLLTLFNLMSCSTTEREDSEVEEPRRVYYDGGSIRP
jgi:hypothetical protein